MEELQLATTHQEAPLALSLRKIKSSLAVQLLLETYQTICLKLIVLVLIQQNPQLLQLFIL